MSKISKHFFRVLALPTWVCFNIVVTDYIESDVYSRLRPIKKSLLNICYIDPNVHNMMSRDMLTRSRYWKLSACEWLSCTYIFCDKIRTFCFASHISDCSIWSAQWKKSRRFMLSKWIHVHDWLILTVLTGTTTPGQDGPGTNGNEEVLPIPPDRGASPSDAV